MYYPLQNEDRNLIKDCDEICVLCITIGIQSIENSENSWKITRDKQPFAPQFCVFVCLEWPVILESNSQICCFFSLSLQFLYILFVLVLLVMFFFVTCNLHWIVAKFLIFLEKKRSFLWAPHPWILNRLDAIRRSNHESTENKGFFFSSFKWTESNYKQIPFFFSCLRSSCWVCQSNFKVITPYK